MFLKLYTSRYYLEVVDAHLVSSVGESIGVVCAFPLVDLLFIGIVQTTSTSFGVLLLFTGGIVRTVMSIGRFSSPLSKPLLLMRSPFNNVQDKL